jgi:hypothetical protein
MSVVAFIRRCVAEGADYESALQAAEIFEGGGLFSEPSLFPSFWSAYPNKIGKRDAETAYKRALKRARHQTIMEGLARALQCRRWADGYVPNPSTWLNQDRWLDQPDLGPRSPTTGGMVAAASDELAFRIATGEISRDVLNGRNNGRDQSPLTALPTPTAFHG